MKGLTKVKFSNLEKVLYPELQITKSNIIEYYIKTAQKILPFLEDRALVRTRYPDGIIGEGFYEKDTPKGTPEWVQTFTKYSWSVDKEIDYVVTHDVVPVPGSEDPDLIVNGVGGHEERPVHPCLGIPAESGGIREEIRDVGHFPYVYIFLDVVEVVVVPVGPETVRVKCGDRYNDEQDSPKNRTGSNCLADTG